MSPLDDIEALSLALSGDGPRLVTGLIRNGSASRLVKDGFLIRDGEKDEWSIEMEPYSTPIYHDRDRRFCYTPFPVELTQDDVQLWSANPRKIAEHIQSIVGCGGRGIEELIPRRLYCLGRTDMTIGRRRGREIYFLTNLTGNDSIRTKLPQSANDFLVIIGYVQDLTLCEKLWKLTYRMDQLFSVSKDGEWTMNADVIEYHFGTPVKPPPDTDNGSLERKAKKLARFFMNECFYHRSRYDVLSERRKTLLVQGNVANFAGVSPKDVSNAMGKRPLRDNKFPVLCFWRSAFMNDDLYNLFLKVVEEDPDHYKKMKPEQLKELILGEKDKAILACKARKD